MGGPDARLPELGRASAELAKADMKHRAGHFGAEDAYTAYKKICRRLPIYIYDPYVSACYLNSLCYMRVASRCVNHHLIYSLIPCLPLTNELPICRSYVEA